MIWLVIISVYLAIGVSWVCGLRRFDMPWFAFYRMGFYPETYDLLEPAEVGAGAIFWVISFLTYLFCGFFLLLYVVLAFPTEWFGRQIQKVCK